MLLSTLFVVQFLSSNSVDISEVIQDTQINIERFYVEQRSIETINQSLSAPQLLQQLDQAETPDQLAKNLTQHLQKFDAHFTVQYQSESTSALEVKESWFSKLARKNYGFSKVEVLEGNVGLLVFWGFADLNQAVKDKISAVMSLLLDVDALIIDLRANGGGSGETVQWLSSYFVDGKVHLNSFYTRYNDSEQTFWTHPQINYDHLEQIPLYILTSDQTFSAAEEFTYNFKHLGRAVIVGEPSKGGANPWRWFNLTQGFRLGIPTTKAINPITQGNWESKGVQPNIVISADNALDLAYKHALESLLENADNGYRRQEIEQQLQRMKTNSTKD
ncbi:S41 family peptidase [Glaciecola sp. 1036]|uniref:S41 family peptidase n=1 Tax=Alteromonadaceae TaxID=72275 RepID=UPI003D07F5AC